MKNNIYRVLIAFVLLLSTSALLAGEACAQDEHEGFFKRMMKRFQREDVTTTDQERVEPRRAGSLKPTIPSASPAPKVVTIPERPVQVKPKEIATERPTPKETEKKELTREEMLKEMYEELEYNEDILGTIPSLKRKIDNKGNIFYALERDGIEKNLEDLSDDDLENIYMRVISESSRLGAQGILDQLEQIRQTQRIIQGPPTIPQQPPRTPRTVQSPLNPGISTAPILPARPPAPPPQIPAQPPSPSQPSRIPTPPPTPPASLPTRR